MTLGRFWLVIPRPHFAWPRHGVMEDGTWYFHWGGFSVGAWSRERWSKR